MPDSIPSVMRRALGGTLPPRYGHQQQADFRELVEGALFPGAHVLDVGSGRFPSLTPEQREDLEEYVGLDISKSELEASPAGSYNEMVASDVSRPITELEHRFDLIVTWQVLEHVRHLDLAFETMRRYLKPGGTVIAVFSGKFSLFGMLNQLLPHRLKVFVLRVLLRRPVETVFPAHYNQCWDSAIRRIMGNWSKAEVRPYYTAAGYFRFSRPLQAAYLGYEELIFRRRQLNLAAYYLVRAVA